MRARSCWGLACLVWNPDLAQSEWALQAALTIATVAGIIHARGLARDVKMSSSCPLGLTGGGRPHWNSVDGVQGSTRSGTGRRVPERGSILAGLWVPGWGQAIDPGQWSRHLSSAATLPLAPCPGPTPGALTAGMPWPRLTMQSEDSPVEHHCGSPCHSRWPAVTLPC